MIFWSFLKRFLFGKGHVLLLSQKYRKYSLIYYSKVLLTKRKNKLIRKNGNVFQHKYGLDADGMVDYRSWDSRQPTQ